MNCKRRAALRRGAASPQPGAVELGSAGALGPTASAGKRASGNWAPQQEGAVAPPSEAETVLSPEVQLPEVEEPETETLEVEAASPPEAPEAEASVGLPERSAPTRAAASEALQPTCASAPEGGGETSSPVCARAEDFAGAPADVLLTYARPVDRSQASGCVGLSSAGVGEAFGGVEQGDSPQTLRLQLVPGGSMPAKVLCAAPIQTGKPGDPAAAQTGPAATASSATLPVLAAAPSSGGVLRNPINRRNLEFVPFGRYSWWIQPWRAYMDTWPASRLLDALGINFQVNPTYAEPVAQLLAESGFKLARREVPWDSLSYSEPTKFAHESRIHDVLVALHSHGLRPLLTLNANSVAPGPYKIVRLVTLFAAPAGARAVTLTASSAAQVVPGKTGFNQLSFGGNPDILITAVGPGDVATLSRPLPNALAAGLHAATTLRYAPFAAPKLANGQPNPVFKETLAGWLSYVSTVCKAAAEVVGPGGFDLEVWNELTFGSQFLNSMHYYAPEAQGPSKTEVTRAIIKKLLAETVAFVRNPANGLSPGVGVTNGFASQTPFPSGASAPIGLTALSKHPYVGQTVYPGEFDGHGASPVDALGERDGPKSTAKPAFMPAFTALFPENMLTAIHTETLIRDVAPFTNLVYRFPHGRFVGPPGGQPVQKWITEYNLGVPAHTPGLTAADKSHFHAKVVLRSLIANANKGINREYFYKAGPGGLSLIDERFWSAVEAAPESYPGRDLGGTTMTALRNLVARFKGPGPGASPRQLQLTSIAQDGNHAQFAGDASASHPDLYDRDVLGVFPFQSSPTRFVIPVYVMTRDLLTNYDPGASASDVRRFDLPEERFRITLANLPDTASAPAVSAYDPLRDSPTPARLISRAGSSAVFEVAASDYPRILTIDYAGG